MRRQVLLVLCAGLTVLASPLKAEVIAVGSTSVLVGATFEIPVTISGVSDLYAFQFDLSYNPSVLQLNSILEGAFLPSAGPTFFIAGIIDNSVGVATFTADTLIGAIPGAAVAGILADLDFEAVAAGGSALNLANVILLDSNLNDIAFTSESGQVSVVSGAPEPDSKWVLSSAILLLFLVRRRSLLKTG